MDRSQPMRASRKTHSHPKMGMRAMTMAALATLTVLLAAVHAAPVSLHSAQDLLSLINATSQPDPLTVLFYGGSDTSFASDSPRALFAEVAASFPPRAMRFAEISMNAPGVRTVAPVFNLAVNMAGEQGEVFTFNSRLAVPWAPAGGAQIANPLFIPERFPTTLHRGMDLTSSAAHLREFLLSIVPTRYRDPVTDRPVDSVHYVFSIPEVHQIAQWFQSAKAANEISAVPSTAVLFYVDLTSTGSEELIAAVSSIASQLTSRVVVLATESEDVAEDWGLTTINSMAHRPVSHMNSPSHERDGSGSNAMEVNLLNVGELLHNVANDPATSRHYQQTVHEQKRRLSEWEADVARYSTRCPLRKLENTQQFAEEVTQRNVTFKALFFLRESDQKFFVPHHRLAVEFARIARDGYLPGRQPNAKQNPIPLPGGVEVFWIDAEKQPSVAAALQVTAVPGVAMLFPLQAGSYGVRHYTVDDNNGVRTPIGSTPPKTTFPETAARLVKFYTSEDMLENVQSGMRPFKGESVVFDVDEAVGREADRSSLCDKTYLKLDLRYHPLQEMQENTYVQRLVRHQIPLKAKRTRKAKKRTDGSDEKLSPKEKRRRQQEQQRKEKLRQELEQKRLEREARVQQKLKESEEAREKEKVEMQEQLRKVQQEGGVRGSAVRGPHGGYLVPRPPLSATGAARSRYEVEEEWRSDTRQRADIFISRSKSENRLVVMRTLENPTPKAQRDRASQGGAQN